MERGCREQLGAGRGLGAPGVRRGLHPPAGASCWDTESLGWGLWKNYGIRKTLALSSAGESPHPCPRLRPARTCTAMGPGGRWGQLCPETSPAWRQSSCTCSTRSFAALFLCSQQAPWAPCSKKGGLWFFSCSFLHNSMDLVKWVSKGVRCAGSSPLGCSPQQLGRLASYGRQSCLWLLVGWGRWKKNSKFQINCKFNDCVHEYLIIYICHEYA